MAYQFVDPTPFMPCGAQRVHVEGRKPMSRAILGCARLRNSDLAIVSIAPLPAEQVSFQSIRELIDDFLHNHKHVRFRSIQPCPFIQAYVRLNYYHERDFLIQNSPHNYGNYSISFREHNRGWNNRTTFMNYEMWLMLLGFNVDFWEQKSIEKAISDFGKLVAWEEDPNHLSRVLVKAREVDLSEIP